NLVRPILVSEGWAEGKIGVYVVIGGSIAGIVAGLVAGSILGKLGRKRSIIRLGVLQVVSAFAVVSMSLGSTQEWLVIIVVSLANASFSAAMAIIYTISMDLTRPESAGTDFTFFSTVAQVVMVIAGAGA